MIFGVVSKMAIVAVAAAGLSVPAVATAAPPASAEQQPPCAAAADMPVAGPYATAPAQSCTDAKQQCMSASVQEGIYGERYVPPDAVAMCMQAYRDCVNANSGS